MTLEIIQGLTRKLVFEINKEEVKFGVKAKLKNYAKTAKITGFRPGKVPHNVLEQMYGNSAYEDSLNDKINYKLISLLEQNKIEVAGAPKIDLSSDEGADYIFTAIFEIMPLVAIGDLSNSTIELVSCEINDEAIEQAIAALRKQKINYRIASEEQVASDGDRVTIDFKGTVEGIPFTGGTAENYTLILGQKTMLTDFEQAIYGLKFNGSKTVMVKFPDNYHTIDLAGKTAEFTITVKKIEQGILPELTKEFIIDLGVKDGEINTLKSELKANLNKETTRQIKLRTKNDALKILKTNSPLEVPNAIVEQEIHVMMENTKQNMKNKGMTEKDIKLSHEMFAVKAKEIVILRFLVQEFIRIHELKIKPADTDLIIDELATMYNNPEEYKLWYYRDTSRVNDAAARAMEEKVVSKILSMVQTIITPISYQELTKQ